MLARTTLINEELSKAMSTHTYFFNTNYENFVLIKGFIDETIKIINDILKGKRPRSYTRLDDFNNIPDAPIQNFLPTGGMSQSGAAITGEKREI